MPLYEASVFPAVVLDIGTAYTKCGFAGEMGPRYIIASQVKIRTGQIRKIWDFKNAEDLYEILKEFLKHLYFRHITIKPQDRRVVVCESLLCPTVFRETLAKVLFQYFEVPSVYLVPSHLSALYTLGISRGLAMDVGYKEASVFPIYEGRPILNAYQMLPLAGQAVHRSSSPSQASSPTSNIPEKVSPNAEGDETLKNDREYKVQDFEDKARKEYRNAKKYCRKLEMAKKWNKDARGLEEVEMDPNTLMRRQKDIDYGKNTIGYDNFIKVIPKQKRKNAYPNKYQKCSRRSWDGQMKHWRILLHQFDHINNMPRCNSVASDNLSETSSVNNSEGIEVDEEEEDIDFGIDIDLSLESPPASPHKKERLASPLKERSSHYNVNGQISPM